MIRKMIFTLGGKIADFDTQTGITGAIMRWCWRVGMPAEERKTA